VSEIPSGEAELLGLLDNVHARLSDLSAQMANLDAQTKGNQVAFADAAAQLAARQTTVRTADRKVGQLGAERSAAQTAMQSRAVEAYMHQPSGDMANLFLHLQDPAQLVDARGFYRTLVDVQSKSIKAYDKLTTEARKAAREAAKARDAALHQQQIVSHQKDVLDALRATLARVQQASTQQEAEQSALLSQVGQRRGEFTAALQAQEQQSADIANLLRSLGRSGDTTATATGGYFALPVPGAPITSPFGPRNDPITGYQGFHPGVDFGAKMGTPILAAGDGTVVFALPNGGYGNYTCIDHGHNIATCYAHQSAILVKVGDTVTRGQVIGLIGTTGYSTGPHLHFEVRVSGTPTDPMPWLTLGGSASSTSTPSTTSTSAPPSTTSTTSTTSGPTSGPTTTTTTSTTTVPVSGAPTSAPLATLPSVTVP